MFNKAFSWKNIWYDITINEEKVTDIKMKELFIKNQL